MNWTTLFVDALNQLCKHIKAFQYVEPVKFADQFEHRYKLPMN